MALAQKNPETLQYVIVCILLAHFLTYLGINDKRYDGEAHQNVHNADGQKEKVNGPETKIEHHFIQKSKQYGAGFSISLSKC